MPIKAEPARAARVPISEIPPEVPFSTTFLKSGDHARWIRIQHAEFGPPCVGVDCGEGGRESKPRPEFIREEIMKHGKDCGDPSISKDLTRVAFMAL